MTRAGFFAAAAAVFALSAAGCAASTDDAPLADEDPGPTETDEAALTKMAWYDCSGGASDAILHHLEVGISATRLQLTDLSKDAAPPDMGTLDRTYKPTAQFKNFIRY